MKDYEFLKEKLNKAFIYQLEKSLFKRYSNYLALYI